MDPTQSLYTRQQVGQLAGLDDTTLNYWSRENIIVPTKGGSGRGSHRRFDFIQVNIAAILGQLRRFKLSISVIRSLSYLLQDAAKLGSKRELHPYNYTNAARLATKLYEFRNGTPIMVSKHSRLEKPANLSGATYSEWLIARRAAVTEKEVIHEFVSSSDNDPIDAIVAVAEEIGPGREIEAKIYADLVYDLLDPGFSDSYSWLLGFGHDEGWRIEFGAEGGKFFDHLDGPSPEDFGPGIFLPVSGIIRRVWSLKTPGEYMRDRRARNLRENLAQAGIAANVTPNENPEDGFRIDAPGTEWSIVEEALEKLRYSVERPVGGSTGNALE